MKEESKVLNLKMDAILKGIDMQAPLNQPPPVSQPTPTGSNLQGRILDLPYIML